jgi:hypothetical protein
MPGMVTSVRCKARRAVLRSAAGACVGWVAIGCSPSLDWREVAPNGTQVRFVLPCRPAHQKRELNLTGVAVQAHLHACRVGDHAWALAWADLRDPQRVEPALTAMRESARARLAATAAEPRALRVPGATPNAAAGRWRLIGRGSNGKPVEEQLALFSHGTQIFQATVVGEGSAQQAAETFFASLRLATAQGGS